MIKWLKIYLKEILILQLNLDIDINNSFLVINNIELPSEIKKEYQKTVDILVTINDNIITALEFNRSKYNSIKTRNVIYFGKLYGVSLKEGENIKELKNYINWI